MRKPSSAWMLVALLWVVAMLNYLDRQVIFSMLPLLQREMGLRSEQLGLLGTVFLWSYAFASPLAGFLGDRLGPRRLILFSLAVWSGVTFLTGQSAGPISLLAARGLMGLSEACYIPAGLAMIASAHGPATRSRAIGVHQSGIAFGMIAGGFGGGWFGEHYGWRMVFAGLGIAGVLYALFLTFVLPRPPASLEKPAPPRFRESVSELMRTPAFLVCMLVFAIQSLANWLVFTWMPLYLYERFHMSLAGAGFGATFYVQVASMAGMIGGGWLADRWSRRDSRGRVWTQTLGLVAAAPFLVLSGFTGTPAVLYSALVIFGIGRGLYDGNVMPVLCDCTSERTRSTGYGLLNFAGTFCGGIGAGMAGYLKASIGLGGAIQLSGWLVLVGALALSIGFPAALRRQAAQDSALKS